MAAAVDGRVLIYVHKEEALDDVERRCRAGHYVVVDDKLQILTAISAIGARVTTVFARQGSYGRDPAAASTLPAPDVTVEHIGDLRDWEPHRLREAACSSASNLKVVP